MAQATFRVWRGDQKGGEFHDYTAEVGEGMVVIEDDRCVYANHAFEQLSGYTFPELTALESLFEIVDPDERPEAERRARLRAEQDLVDPNYSVRIRRRDDVGGPVSAG